MATKNKGLGRGLEALLSGHKTEKDDVLMELSVSRLGPGKYQPRSRMDTDSLAELAESVKKQGVMQPILVREVVGGDYEIIAGERRWRAAQLAELTHVPVLVRSVDDHAALAMALIENIQRENLNPLEEAQGIQRLIDEFNMTHQLAADAVGRSRSAASNLLRLLKLSPAVQDLLMSNKLDMGHARALIALEPVKQVMLANKIILEQLTVREAEALAAQPEEAALPKKASAKKSLDKDAERLQETLSNRMGTRVQIKPKAKGGGALIINYANADHLDELLAAMGQSSTDAA